MMDATVRMGMSPENGFSINCNIRYRTFVFVANGMPESAGEVLGLMVKKLLLAMSLPGLFCVQNALAEYAVVHRGDRVIHSIAYGGDGY